MAANPDFMSPSILPIERKPSLGMGMAYGMRNCFVMLTLERNLGDQSFPPTNLGRLDEEIVPPGRGYHNLPTPMSVTHDLACVL
ncbi:hypothetical protein TNCV_538301 [Trichonephila clavipes]|nr:hypothetical protein TNCV_538301 [Trichonephila clavipes]